MKKQITIVITAIAFTLHPTILSANFTDDPSYKEEYSFDMSDSNQKKMATGMIMWGFFLVIASALISAFIPNSTLDATAPTPPSPGPLI